MKARTLKRKGAVVYYRDFSVKAQRFTLVKGYVTDYKLVEDAEREWNQKWSHKKGTILEIEPVEEVTGAGTRRYRHMSSVLTSRQYRDKEMKVQRRKHGRPIGR